MKRGRTRLIVAQSLITAVLLGVIAVTILNPTDQDQLFGVNVPGPNGATVQSPPGYEPETGPGGGGGDQAGGGANGAVSGPSGTSAGDGAAGTTAGGTTPTTPTAPPEGGTGGDETPGPPGEQYDDTLARLSATVN